MVDAAITHRNSGDGGGSGYREFKRHGLWVPVRNDSGDDRKRFEILAINGSVLDPADDLETFQNRVAFKGVVPTADKAGLFVVLQEPIHEDAVGLACIIGITVVKLDIASSADESATFADVKDGAADRLSVNNDKGAQILWKEPGNDPTNGKWGIIRIGAGGDGGTLKFAKITGHAGTAPPYRYTAIEVVHDGSSSFESGNFIAVSGGTDLSWKLINLPETNAVGSSPLKNGDVVGFWPMGSNFACCSSNDKGTY